MELQDAYAVLAAISVAAAVLELVRSLILPMIFGLFDRRR